MNSLYSLIKLIIMNKYSFLLFFILTILSSCSTEETTVYYLIRHAEKDRTDNTNINPNLNKVFDVIPSVINGQLLSFNIAKELDKRSLIFSKIIKKNTLTKLDEKKFDLVFYPGAILD